MSETPTEIETTSEPEEPETEPEVEVETDPELDCTTCGDLGCHDCTGEVDDYYLPQYDTEGE